MNLFQRINQFLLQSDEDPFEDRAGWLQIEVQALEPRVYLGGFAGGAVVDPAVAMANPSTAPATSNPQSTTVVQYDFRDLGAFQNHITSAQIQRTEEALQAWSTNSGGVLQFVHAPQAPDDEILNLGVGDLAAVGLHSAPGGTLGAGGGRLRMSDQGQPILDGVAWLDVSENWDTVRGSDQPGTFDFYAAMGHEIGHALGFEHETAHGSEGVMARDYLGEASAAAMRASAQNAVIAGLGFTDFDSSELHFEPLDAAAAQLKLSEVERLLHRASAATASEDAIIAIVDREGHILGVQIEDGVVAANDEVLSFMVDGAVAKARTAALFSNGDPTNQPQSNGTLAPLTSRTVRFISQSTITQREVESNPNATDGTLRGPGFVAPIGLGGHFPPEIAHTPVVDLFAIEHTNRDSLIHAGPNGIREGGGGDDITLSGRFDADFIAGQEIDAPESYGFVSGLAPTQQSRGIATLPGGIPIFRDTNGDGAGDFLVGGIGVFFPGPDGYATYEQSFVAGVGQTELDRTNAPKVLESEYIAFAAIGGSVAAENFGTKAEGASAAFNTLGGVDRVDDIDLPFGILSLVGINLQVVGPTAGIEGVRELMTFGNGLSGGTVNGTTELFANGEVVPDGWLVAAKDGNGITQAEVEQIIQEGILSAQEVRAAVRLPLSSQTRMVFAITDLDGEVVGLYRMQDATVFSVDVAVAKARNVRYYADAAALQPEDATPGVAPGVAFTNRTFRYLAEPRFPDGVDGTDPPQFSILNNPSVNSRTAENLGAPADASTFDGSVLGYDAFNVGTNFRDSTTPLQHQNGIVFFPGSTPLYRNGQLIGGFGVSGDGVDQDDVVTFLAARNFLPSAATTRADQVSVDGVRLPYMKFLRNPFGTVR